MILINILKGILIGTGGIAPGVSGGTFAMMLGVYDKATDAIGNFYKDFKTKFIFLSTLGLGVAIGIIGFSRVLEYLFISYEMESKFVFIGIMLGSFPSIVKDANKQGFKKRYILPMILTLLMTTLFAILEGNAVANQNIVSLTFWECVLYGAIIALGTIIPGVSSSILLMYAGVYSVILDAIGSIRIEILFPLGLGFVLTMLILSKCIHFMFKNYYGWTYYMVLGFIFGSVLALVPKVDNLTNLAYGLFLALLSMIASYFMTLRLLSIENRHLGTTKNI